MSTIVSTTESLSEDDDDDDEGCGVLMNGEGPGDVASRTFSINQMHSLHMRRKIYKLSLWCLILLQGTTLDHIDIVDDDDDVVVVIDGESHMIIDLHIELSINNNIVSRRR